MLCCATWMSQPDFSSLARSSRELLLLGVEVGGLVQPHDDRRGVGGSTGEGGGQGGESGIGFARDGRFDQLDFGVGPELGLDQAGLVSNHQRRGARRRGDADRERLLRPGVEELRGDHRHEHAGQDHHDAGDAQDAPAAAAIVESRLEERGVDPLDESLVMLGALVGIELDAIDEEACQHRHDRQCANQGGQQRERHREREGEEELAHESAHEAERQEDGDRGQRGAGDRARDFTRARYAGLTHWLALAAMPVDVLQDHDCVVDDPADGYRQSAQGHDVDADAEHEHQRQCAHDRDGDAHRGHERGPKAEQEQEDGEEREEGAQEHLHGPGCRATR